MKSILMSSQGLLKELEEECRGPCGHDSWHMTITHLVITFVDITSYLRPTKVLPTYLKALVDAKLTD